VLTAACFSLASCTTDSGGGSPPLPTPEPSSESVILDCANGLGTGLRTDELQVVLGVVALPASPRAAALQTARSGDGGQPRLFAKSALVIRAGASFELLAVQAPPRGPTFSWSPGISAPTRRLVVSECRSTENSRWLAFIGGYYVNRTSCATVIVRTATRQQRVRIGLGASCPGQRPPQGPSQG